MSWHLDRRAVLSGLGLSAATAMTPKAFARNPAKVVIIGGGYGGATAASTLKAIAPEVDVTLIETNRTYHSCPMSNLVIAGHKPPNSQTFRYDSLEQRGINIINGWATNVDPAIRTVMVGDNQTLSYDRLILSPGIDIRWGAIEGYDKGDATRFPHAWKGRMQRQLLQQQLNALEDGQTVLMSVPPAPYRCPPGPYERASLIAHYLKTQKPKSKLIILDSKDSFSKMPLFQEAWAANYPDHLEWISASNDGRVSRVDTKALTVSTDFEDYQVDVANIIPPQKAGQIADRAGVADATGWCPINATTFESTLQSNIHVIGDATIAAPMPKSAFSANLQGKLCAMAVAELLAGRTPKPTVLANTCYSYTSPSEAVSIVGVYSNADGVFQSIPDAGGLSPLAAETSYREAEAQQAQDWFKTITTETFG